MNMGRWMWSSVALAAAVLLGTPLQAQIHGTPSSVTSPGFGGRAVNGTPPSVTSLGPRGAVPNSGRGVGAVPRNQLHQHEHQGEHNRRYYGGYYGYPYYYAPYDYGYDQQPPDNPQDQYANPNNSSDYQGGPTIFDRRGHGEESYVPPVENAAPAHPQQEASAEPSEQPESPVTPTVLVFKDGHQIEVDNYAIVGQMLYDLTPGHARKVPLSSLNLDETQKQNEDRGLNFQIPASTQPG